MITIQKGTGDFTVILDDGTAKLCPNGAYYLQEDSAGTPGQQIVSLRKVSDDKALFITNPANITNGDTSNPFVAYTDLLAYCKPMLAAGGGSRTAAISVLPGAKTLTDASISSGSGASVSILTANPAGAGIQIYNPSATATAWINNTGAPAAANGAGSFPISPGGSYEDVLTNGVTALVVSGQPLTIKTY